MSITNSESGINVHEVSDGIYRINMPVVIKGGGGFSFNQYLIVDDEPCYFTLVHEGCFLLCVKLFRAYFRSNDFAI